MIILDTPTRQLEVVLGGAKTTSDCSASACWSDTLGRRHINATATDGTTAVVLCHAPATGQSHQIEEVSLVNEDSASITATIRVTDSANAPSTALSRTLLKVILDAGDNLVYSSGAGWIVLTGAGELKNSV